MSSTTLSESRLKVSVNSVLRSKNPHERLAKVFSPEQLTQLAEEARRAVPSSLSKKLYKVVGRSGKKVKVSLPKSEEADHVGDCIHSMAMAFLNYLTFVQHGSKHPFPPVMISKGGAKGVPIETWVKNHERVDLASLMGAGKDLKITIYTHPKGKQLASGMFVMARSKHSGRVDVLTLPDKELQFEDRKWAPIVTRPSLLSTMESKKAKYESHVLRLLNESLLDLKRLRAYHVSAEMGVVREKGEEKGRIVYEYYSLRKFATCENLTKSRGN